MTNENIIEIKKEQKNWMVKGFILLFFMLVSLFIALLPLVLEFAKTNSAIFYVSGFTLFAGFTLLYGINLYKAYKPSNALVLSARGFIDRLNIGDNIEIEWTNVSAVRMLGRANMPFLGVTLENPDIILVKMKKSAAAEMRENIDQNLPTLLIPQSKVRVKIKDLKDTFAKFAREARVLEKDSTQKIKNNPFSTDDVLRAFGKLPKDENENAESEQLNNDETTPDKIVEETTFNSNNVDDLSEYDEVNSPNEAENSEFYVDDHNDSIIPLSSVEEYTNDDENKLNAEETPVEETLTNEKSAESFTEEKNTADDILDGNATSKISQSAETNETQSEHKLSASDSFYAALRAKASSKTETVSETSTVPDININNAFNSVEDNGCSSEEEMPDEIQEILSRAKFSKIAEIEKILSDTDIPFSLSRGETNRENDGAPQISKTELADVNSVSNIPQIDIALEVDNESDTNSDNSDSPSLGNLFGDDVHENEEIKFDLNFVSDIEDVNDDDQIGVSLESFISDALKSNGNNTTPVDNSNLGDTKEFIIDN